MSPGAWALRFAGTVGPAALFFGAAAVYGLGGGRLPLDGNAGLVALGVLVVIGAWLFVNLGILSTLASLFQALRLLAGRGLPRCPECDGLGH